MMGFPHEIDFRSEIRPMSLVSTDDTLIAALEALPDGIAVFDENLQLVFANERYRDFLGEWSEHVRPGMAVADIVCQLADSGRIVKVEESQADGRGATEWLLSDGRVVRFAAYPVLKRGRLCVGRDVTKVASARMTPGSMPAPAVEASAPRDVADWRVLGEAADALGIGVVLLNPAGEPDFFNEQYRSFLGMAGRPFDRADLGGLGNTRPIAYSVRRWRGEVNDNEPDGPCRVGVGDGVVQEGTTTDGRTIRYTLRTLAQGNMLCLGTDITALKRLEQDTARLHAEVESARHVRDRFLASVSHEIRTPLNAIVGFTQMMLRDGGNSPTVRQREYLEAIFQSSGYLLDLVNRTLDLQGIQAGRFTLATEPVDIAGIVRECVGMLAPKAEVLGISLREECLCDERTTVAADPSRLRQVVANLLSNAVKYNRPGGHAWVTCALVDDGRCRVSVRDTGCGIPRHRRQGLFQPFARLDEGDGRIEGAGIGLALSKELVERMGGRIGMDDEPGGGSTFWIELPLARGASEPCAKEI